MAMTLARYAVDIVILPPRSVTELSIAWNRELARKTPQVIQLNATDTLPHVSLLMGCLRADHFTQAMQAFTKVMQQWHSFSVTVSGIKASDASHPVASLDITLSPSLMEFQRAIIGALGPWLSRDATIDDLADPPPIEAASVEWINQFVPDQCDERFWPHITLGHGLVNGDQPAFDFTVSRIAICHLGNHCTCRRILAEASLS